MRNKGNILLPLLIIFAILALSALVLFKSQKTTLTTTQPTPSAQENQNTAANMSTSDDPASIEKDLNTTDLGNVDSELNSIDAQL